MVEVAVNPDLQRRFRDSIKSPDAPAFLDSSVPITPVVNIDYILSGKQVLLSASQNGAGTTTLYTVPAGKEFYLFNCSLSVNNTIAVVGIENGQMLVYDVTGDKTIVNINTIPATVSKESVTQNFSCPIKCDSGATIKVYSSAANVFVFLCIQGYEVNK